MMRIDLSYLRLFRGLVCGMMFCFVCSSIPVAALHPFWESHQDGWFWYEDPLPVYDEEEIPDAPESVPIEPLVMEQPPSNPEEIPSKSATELLAEFQKTLTEFQSMAILDPTPTNINRWLYAQKAALDRSQLFSQRFKQTVMANPDLDYSAVAPISTAGQNLYRSSITKDTKAAISYLKSKTSLFFFYSSTCSFCNNQSDVLFRMSKATGFIVVPVSLDNKAIKPFTTFRYSPDMVANLNIETTPTIYLVEPSSMTFILLSSGFLTDSELVDRMIMGSAKAGILPSEYVPKPYLSPEVEAQNVNAYLSD